MGDAWNEGEAFSDELVTLARALSVADEVLNRRYDGDAIAQENCAFA